MCYHQTKWLGLNHESPSKMIIELHSKPFSTAPPTGSNGALPPAPAEKLEGLQPVGGTSPLAELLHDMAFPLMKAEDETKPNGKWEPQKLNGRHREIMRQILEGSSYGEVAASVGMSTQAVMLVANSAIFKEELSKLESSQDWNVIRRAESLSNEALSQLRDIMRQSRSEMRRESAADKILGMAGYSKIEKKAIAVVSGEDVIRELNKRRREDYEQKQGTSSTQESLSE